MPHEIKIPEAGESIREVQIGQWLKQEGQWADKDENLVEIETDKATMELAAPAAGVVTKILKPTGSTAQVGEVIAQFEERAKPAQAQAKPESPRPDAKSETSPSPAATIMPAAKRALAEAGLQPDEVTATGPGGRLLKEDVLRHAEARKEPQPESPAAPRPQSTAPPVAASPRQEEVVPMSLIRRRIAERLVEAQQTSALLTTFNEIDMAEVIDLRTKYRDAFQKKYSVKLGFMSFFVKATVEALKAYTAVNAEIRGNDVVYRNYYDIGIAVGGGKGLVVPVVRNAERMSFAEIEQTIEDFGHRAQENKIKPEELSGGTFSISNGGVYGSLLSTPIVNPPQSGILGLHAIQERPVARQGQVVIRPMMYVALTYDHRIVDGREAVGFLRRIKEIIEEPARMMLEV